MYSSWSYSSSDPRRVHVRVPQAVAADYDIMPQSTVKKAGRIKSKEVSDNNIIPWKQVLSYILTTIAGNHEATHKYYTVDEKIIIKKHVVYNWLYFSAGTAINAQFSRLVAEST